MIIVDIPNEEEIDDAGVLALGVVIDEEGFLHITESADNAVDDAVDPHDLADHGLELREQRVFRIGRVIDLPPVLLGFQEVSFGQLVQLFTYRVRGDMEFGGELAKIGTRLRVEEEAHQELDSGFG